MKKGLHVTLSLFIRNALPSNASTSGFFYFFTAACHKVHMNTLPTRKFTPQGEGSMSRHELL